jgi:hypothetical protein
MADFKCKQCGLIITEKEIRRIKYCGDSLIIFGILFGISAIAFSPDIDSIIFMLIGIWLGRTVLRSKPGKEYCASCQKKRIKSDDKTGQNGSG